MSEKTENETKDEKAEGKKSDKPAHKLAVEKMFQLPENNVESEHVLKADEVITRIHVPQPADGSRSVYLKFREKQSLDFAISSVAALLQMDGDKVKSARIVLGGVAPMPWRVKKAEGELKGKQLSDTVIERAAKASVADAEPLSDNAFKIQWELFLKHVVNDEPFRWSLLEGAKGVQLAEKALESWEKRAWVDLPRLE